MRQQAPSCAATSAMRSSSSRRSTAGSRTTRADVSGTRIPVIRGMYATARQSNPLRRAGAPEQAELGAGSCCCGPDRGLAATRQQGPRAGEPAFHLGFERCRAPRTIRPGMNATIDNRALGADCGHWHVCVSDPRRRSSRADSRCRRSDRNRHRCPKAFNRGVDPYEPHVDGLRCRLGPGLVNGLGDVIDPGDPPALLEPGRSNCAHRCRSRHPAQCRASARVCLRSVAAGSK